MEPMTIRNVALPDRATPHTITIADGRLATVEPSSRPGTPERLALPAFADLHVHADRAFVAGPCPARSLADAIALVNQAKAKATATEIRERARQLLERALSHGSLRVRSHVDVDDLVGGRAFEGVLAAGADLAGRLTLETVAFATARCDPATPEGRARLTEASRIGADRLGAVVAFLPDPKAALDALLDLALELDLPVDLHLDEHGDSETAWLEYLAERVIAMGLRGRVTVSHACALAKLDHSHAARVVKKVAAADLTVIALPALNLYLQDRGQGTPRWRGLTLVHELLDSGVAVRFASDNVRDVFFPFGDADPLEAAFLAGLAAHVDDKLALISGICDGRSTLKPGDPANLVLIPAASTQDALARRPAGRTVLDRGTCVAGSALQDQN